MKAHMVQLLFVMMSFLRAHGFEKHLNHRLLKWERWLVRLRNYPLGFCGFFFLIPETREWPPFPKPFAVETFLWRVITSILFGLWNFVTLIWLSWWSTHSQGVQSTRKEKQGNSHSKFTVLLGFLSRMFKLNN